MINQNTTYKRYVTAAHCGTQQDFKRWDPNDTSFQPSTYVDEAYNKDSDLSWFRPDALTVQPYFYGGVRAGGGTLQLGGKIAAVGTHLCHQGMVTDYSCGDVTSTAYAPNYSGACPSMPCHASFVLVSGSNLYSLPGDSGGPYFLGSYVYGAQKGDDIDADGRDGDTWYSKVAYIPYPLLVYTRAVE